MAPGALQSVLISATIGEIGGAISGGIAANAAGGDVGKGMLFGAIVGGVTGAISEGMFPADKLAGWEGLKLFGARVGQGAIYGTGYGATSGYAGGKGGTREIIRGMYQGAILGAATGALIGGGEWYLNRSGNSHLNLLGVEENPLKAISGIPASEGQKSVVPYLYKLSAEAGGKLSIDLLSSTTIAAEYNVLAVAETTFFSYPSFARELWKKKLEEGFSKHWSFSF